MARAITAAVGAGRKLTVSGTGFYTAGASTALTGNNNDLDFTAKEAGVNDITVTYVDPGGTTAALSVSVSSHAITVNLARAASAISSTAAQVKAAIDAHAGASALVSVANHAGNDGTGLVTAMSALPLTTLTVDSGVELEFTAPDGVSITTVDAVVDGGTGAVSVDSDFNVDLENVGVATVRAIRKSDGVVLAEDTVEVFSD